MAKTRSKKTSNRQSHQINLAEGTPLEIGRSIRELVANRDKEELFFTVASLMARCEAKIIKGTNLFTPKSLEKWSWLVFQTIDVYQLLRNVENLASRMDDEKLGAVITDVIVQKVIEVKRSEGNQNGGLIYVRM